MTVGERRATGAVEENTGEQLDARGGNVFVFGRVMKEKTPARVEREEQAGGIQTANVRHGNIFQEADLYSSTHETVLLSHYI